MRCICFLPGGGTTGKRVLCKKNPSPAFPELPVAMQGFRYAELRAATRNFHRVNIIGEGGFGCVYKARIASKTDVAIKHLNTQGQQGHKEWVAEVHFLGLVEHPNLVKLLGYCAEDDNDGLKRLLVYEFMPNKSLDYHLFQGGRMIPWSLRLHIALGAAQGLAYLHEENYFQIIFRDFKSSNILLDKDFNPKLSDFGLAREGPEAGHSHVSTGVVGTVGYAAPEYIETGHLTAKSDVWSFGVVLLELLSGRKAIDRSLPQKQQHLTDWVKPFLHDTTNFPSLMDPRLDRHYPLLQAQCIASLANQCLVNRAKSRPNMSQVVKELKVIADMKDDYGSPHHQSAFILPSSRSLSTMEASNSSKGNRKDLLCGIRQIFVPKILVKS